MKRLELAASIALGLTAGCALFDTSDAKTKQSVAPGETGAADAGPGDTGATQTCDALPGPEHDRIMIRVMSRLEAAFVDVTISPARPQWDGQDLSVGRHPIIVHASPTSSI